MNILTKVALLAHFNSLMGHFYTFENLWDYLKIIFYFIVFFFFFFIYFLKKLNKKWLSLVGRKLSRSGDTFGPNMII